VEEAVGLAGLGGGVAWGAVFGLVGTATLRVGKEWDVHRSFSLVQQSFAALDTYHDRIEDAERESFDTTFGERGQLLISEQRYLQENLLDAAAGSMLTKGVPSEPERSGHAI
jgi:hypothetical protein